MGLIVILSSLTVLVPSLFIFYQSAKKTLLDNELSQLQYQIQLLADDVSSDVSSAEVSLENLAGLINRNIADANGSDIRRFEERIKKTKDGTWRNNLDTYNGSTQAGLFLPPDTQVTEDKKRFFGKMLTIFEAFGTSSNSKTMFMNTWFLGHERSELIFDVVNTDFVYMMAPDTDYTQTDWMTLASPERNVKREAKWTPPLYDPVLAEWIVSAIYPLDINEQWVGTLGHDIPLKSLFNLLESISNKYEGNYHFLKDAQGQFIVAGPWQEELEEQTERFVPDENEASLLSALSEPFSNRTSILSEVQFQGESYQAIALKIRPMNWTYLNLVPTNEILSPLVNLLLRGALALVITVLLISVLINTSVRRMIAKPIQKLVEREHTRSLLSDNEPEPFVSWGSNELSELASTLDLMHEDLEKETERIAFLATHDELTKLPNRTLLNDHLELAITHTQRSNTKAAVLFIDLDQFKVINDSFGHQFGDKLLKCVAERISAELRKGDTVARFGGDEFVVVLTEIKELIDVSHLAEKLLFVIKQPYYIDQNEFNITASIGISLCPDDSEQPETLIQSADTAMYQSKSIGRNAFQFYTKAIHEKVLRKHNLEEALRKALLDKQFILHYQPKIDLKTKQIFGVEALVRWKHPELGIVSPAEFIPLAEETGLIIDIGAWVLEEACQKIGQWSESYPWLTNMAINLSARQFQQEDFVTKIKSVLQNTQVDAGKIEFEITESLIMDNVNTAISILANIQILGISVSIDDFGTGYSSLSYLKHLPANALKIDRSFVSELASDEADQPIVRSILALAENLQLKVIAEGVEDEEQNIILTKMGCDYAQGYYYSRPLPANELLVLFENQQSELKGKEKES